MKNPFAIIIAMIITVACHAQSKTGDSLQLVLSKRPNISDTTTAKLNNLLYSEWSRINPDSALFYAKKAYTISKKINHKAGQAESCNNLGWVNINTGNIVTGFEYYQEAVSLYISLHDDNGLAQVYNGLGVTFGMQEKYAEALSYFLKALSLNEKNNNTAGLVNTNLKIGALYLKSNDLDKALSSLNKALVLAEKTGDKRNAAHIYYNIASLYGKLKQYNKALEAILKSKQLAEETGSLPAVANAELNLGKVYIELGNFCKAEVNLLQAINSFKQLKNKEQIALAYNGLSALYFKTNKPLLAKVYIDSSITIARDINSSGLLYDNYETLAEINEKKGDYKTASVYHNKMLVLKDSLFNAEKLNTLDKLKASYELEKKQTTIEDLKHENYLKTQQRNHLLIAIIFCAVLVILLTFSLLNINNKNRLLLERKKQLKKLNDLKDKFFSIISHDLRSPLANIIGSLNIISQPGLLNEEEKKKLIDQVMANSSSALETMDNMVAWGRYQLNNTENMPVNVNIYDMLQRIHRLLQHSALTKEIDIAIRIDEPTYAFVDENQLEFVLRNLISNALKFSYPKNVIEIWCRKFNSSVYLYVRDYGTGMSVETRERLFTINGMSSKKGTSGEIGSGLGLMLCKQFIEENKGNMIVTSEQNKGTTFALELPLGKSYSMQQSA